MKADFQTIGAIFGAFLNGSALALLNGILTNPALKELESSLQNDISTVFAQKEFVKRTRKKLRSSIYSFFVFILHILNQLILLSLFLLLIIGPENIFNPSVDHTLAEPLSFVEKILFWTWFVIGLLAYLIKAFLPTLKLIRLDRKAARWLRERRSRQSRS